MDDFIPRDNPRYAENLAKFLEGNHPNVPTEVFHASKTDVQKFDPKKRGKLSPFGYHFGTADQANFRTGQYDFESPMPNIGKYHLSMKNPLEVSHMASFAPDHLADHMMDLDILDPDDYDRLNEKHDYEPIPVGGELVKILKKNGYDGLMYQNEREGEGYSFVPFDANQIKSATGNAGGFNREEEDINKAYGGALGDEDDDEGITAYHGSPHDFPTFDMSKVGTGEGAQSYGHGLYFAESEPVAKNYRDRLGKEEETSGETMADQYVIEPHFYKDMDEDEIAENMKEAAKWADKRIFDQGKMKYLFDDGSMLIHDDNGVRAVKKQPGHMYEVRIKAKPEHLLDWDTPLESQPLNVRDAIDEALLHAENKAGNRKFMVGTFNGALFPEKNTVHRNFERLTGGAIHDMLSKVFSPEELSQRLSESGIKGIRYLDQNSRQDREGTRNYVIFDDKLVNVKRKYEKGGIVDEDDPMSRAQEQGFTQDLYHATSSTIPFKRFNSVPGFQAHDLPGVHVGSLKAAHDRAEDYFGVKDWSKAQSNESINESQAPSIMPLKGRLEKAFVKKSGEPYSESELGRKVKEFAKKAGITRPISSREPQRAFAKYLISQGYDHVPYVNSIEDKGNLSYIVLNPSKNIRSRFASFDPEKANLETDLMAKRGGSITKSGRIKRNTGGRIPEMDKLFKRAKKYVDEQTKPMLNLHDDVIVKALNLAKKKV